MVEISSSSNKELLAIVIVGYNRVDGIKRLVSSLKDAHYDGQLVPLVISIDASGNEELYNYVYQVEWEHGEKYVFIQSERLGLKKHIFKCAEFVKYFKGIIMLEDDLYLSKEYYRFAQSCLNYYSDDDSVAEISLYVNSFNAETKYPFVPLNNGSDVFAWQEVASWGQVWNERMWSGFRRWLDTWDGDFGPIDMMPYIKEWDKAWSKYFFAYLISTNRFTVFPYISHSTNFNDGGGVHGGTSNAIFQVPLLSGKKCYNFLPSEELVKYDVYQQNIALYEKLCKSPQELTLDLYGTKQKYKDYLLSIKLLPYKVERSYALQLRPIELNVFRNIEGHGIYLYNLKEKAKAPQASAHMLQSFYYSTVSLKSISFFIASSILSKVSKLFKH